MAEIGFVGDGPNSYQVSDSLMTHPVLYYQSAGAGSCAELPGKACGPDEGMGGVSHALLMSDWKYRAEEESVDRLWGWHVWIFNVPPLFDNGLHTLQIISAFSPSFLSVS
jgi:hypothetical protein